jgi:hypothetical protein
MVFKQLLQLDAIEVNDVFTETDTTGVRADGDAELGGHEENGEDLVDALKPHGIGVATGEHAHNRMVFKQLLQLDAIDVCQIDSCRDVVDQGQVNDVFTETDTTGVRADGDAELGGHEENGEDVFKQLLQLDAIDVCQIDSCRLSGVNEILAVLLM